MEFNLGVFIIGSLYWMRSELRDHWRNNYLEISKAQRVPLPIRYGRLSHSWNNTFTMTFSALPESSQGTGYLVPVKGDGRYTSGDILEQVYAMVRSERKEEHPIHHFDWDWGVIGYLAPPDIDPDRLELVTQMWREHLSDNFDPEVFRTGGADPMIDKAGRLQVDWQEAYQPFDLIIGALTAGADYDPMTSTIADHMVRADDFSYFRNNMKHGIRTFQDNEILSELKNKGIFLFENE